MNGSYLALAGRIRTELSDVAMVVDRAEELADRARNTGDDGFWDAVALNLHGFYSATERIFLDVARTMEANVPAGSGWHQDLLVQMASDLPGVRPPVIHQEARRCLDEYRSFRHLVRNVYAFNLRPSRLMELIDGLRPCLEMTTDDLNQFADLLEHLARQDAE